MTKLNYYILSGAMGGGKSTILTRLQEAGIHCIPEPARDILAEQRAIDAMGVLEKNADLFCMLMLSRSIYNYSQQNSVATPIIFDRGIPDMVAYARLSGLDETPYACAAEIYRYNPTVFYFPAWQEIYTTDAERKMSFEQAQAFGSEVRSIYQTFGYQILELPRYSLEERVTFITDNIAQP